jgi:hypothetical protein
MILRPGFLEGTFMHMTSKRWWEKQRWLTHLGAALALAVPFLTGCHLLPSRDTNNQPTVPPKATPDVPALVNYLNQNAQRVQTVRAKVAIDAKQGRQVIGLDGNLACQKPRDFRLRANVLGQPAVDLGSNEQEFWYWISKASPPYVYHCSYKNLATSKVTVPFPFQPDMVMAALNMAEYDPKARYELKVQAKTLELIQETTSPTGQAVKRVTVFNRLLARSGEPQVLSHLLLDSRGKLICRANVERVTTDRTSGGIIPTRVMIEWPAQSVSMKLMLSDVQANTIDKKAAGFMFSRANLTSYDSFDLARGAIDSPGAVRRAGATSR